MKLGIVGLPNVGKSTLFNSLTKAGAESANYPFCTIDPNVGVVPVPDPCLDKLTAMYNSAKTTPAVIEFVDIAGLVKGAAQGAGLGNKFLGHIRECDALVHVVRCFEDPNVIHVDGHDFNALEEAFNAAAACKGRPTVLLAKTIKGKGVSFMENQAGWHGKAPNDEEYKIAMADLERIGEALCQK